MVEFRTVLGLEAGYSKVYTELDAPPDLGWSSAYPFKVIRDPTGRWHLLNDPKSYVNPAIWTGAAIHVDPVNGSSGNSGLGAFDGDFSAAKATLQQAIIAGNATGAPYRIICRPGRYDQARSINGNSGTTGVKPTYSCAFIGWKGRVSHEANSGESFPATKNATFTNSYVGGPTTAIRVLDLYQFDSYGNPAQIPWKADAVTVDAATDGGWNASNATGTFAVHIRRKDGLQPTVVNTLVIRTLEVTYLDASLTGGSVPMGDLYFENFDFWGGSFGGLYIDGNYVSRNVVCVGCRSRWASNNAQQCDAFTLLNINGLILMVDCEGASAAKDGFNFHYNTGTTARTFVLTVNCKGVDNGKYGIGSTNGWTTHDDIVGIDVGGLYEGQENGSELHSIQRARTWCLGTICRPRAGGLGSAFRISDGATARMWVEETVSDLRNFPGGNGLWAGGTNSLMFKRNHTAIASREQIDAGSSITLF
ncbi:hypothetical protein [Ancylobacter sp. SL191]|uniref:hypothetical protein n=1 Tax=Ancylobacter sp. SL191 TaxID=2995166 RepID=UPI00226EB723|nr:hypothetical protein [Ancylobacter sp. SL191]WAC26353.1 hypothetical protein OU996_15205 [Ancylobacter sp. SL191]